VRFSYLLSRSHLPFYKKGRRRKEAAAAANGKRRRKKAKKNKKSGAKEVAVAGTGRGAS
jgi:hypothetical protein